MSQGLSRAEQLTLPWPNEAQSAILTAVISPDAAIAAEAFERWKELTDLTRDVDAGTYRLMPLLYMRLKEHGIDDDLLGMLKGIYRRTWYENRMLLHKVEPALRVLQEAGIETLVLKGVPLALDYYSSVAVRPMSDIDIVVHPDDLTDALSALRNAGWEPSRQDPLVTQHSEILFTNPEGESLVDLHWHSLSDVRTTAAEAWFWSNARPLQVGEVATLQPSTTTMLLHVMVHGTRSNHVPPIRWITDAATILQVKGRELVDWDAFVAFSRAAKISFRIHLALKYLQEEYGIDVPDRVLSELGGESLSLAERLENRAYLRPLTPGTWGRTDPMVLLYMTVGMLFRAPYLLVEVTVAMAQ